MRFLLLLLALTVSACPPGARGPAGFNGTDGLQGPRGLQGIQGLRGFNGTDGVPGPPGPQNSTFVDGIRVIGTANIDTAVITEADINTLSVAAVHSVSVSTDSVTVYEGSIFSGNVLISNTDDVSWESTYEQVPALKVEGGVAIFKDLAVYGDVFLSDTSILGVGVGLFFGSGPTGSAPQVNVKFLQLSDSRLLTMQGTPDTDLEILPATEFGQFYTLLGGVVTQGYALSPFVTNTTCDFQISLYKNGLRVPIATGMSNAWFTAGSSRVVFPTLVTGQDFDFNFLLQTSLTFGPTSGCQVLSGDGSVNVLLMYMTSFA